MRGRSGRKREAAKGQLAQELQLDWLGDKPDTPFKRKGVRTQTDLSTNKAFQIERLQSFPDSKAVFQLLRPKCHAGTNWR